LAATTMPKAMPKVASVEREPCLALPRIPDFVSGLSFADAKLYATAADHVQLAQVAIECSANAYRRDGGPFIRATPTTQPIMVREQKNTSNTWRSSSSIASAVCVCVDITIVAHLTPAQNFTRASFVQEVGSC